MPTDPADYDPKPFVCQACGWILGESYREPNKRITQLRVYRDPLVPNYGLHSTNPLDHIRFVITRMNDGAVLCINCGNTQTWYANQTAIAEMLERQHVRKMEVCDE